MNFKTVSIIKFPVDTVWDAMLHHLPDIAQEVDDLESITEIRRTKQSKGVIKVESVWKAKPKLPGMVMKYIKPDMLEWTDSATWREKEKLLIGKYIPITTTMSCAAKEQQPLNRQWEARDPGLPLQVIWSGKENFSL